MKNQMSCFLVSVLALALGASAAKQPAQADGHGVLDKMKKLSVHLDEIKQEQASQGRLMVNGPLPVDFAERFAQAVSKATGSDAGAIQLTGSQDVKEAPGIVEISFAGPPNVVEKVEDQAAEARSPLASGNLHSFLVSPGDGESPAPAEPKEEKKTSKAAQEATPIQEKGIDVDTAMPYGDLEPFGREDTAQELTESAVTESDEMVDQLERAEVAEEKRSVFRALTRLRGAAITSFDGIARSQTGNIDEYNKIHKWRKAHPLHHLADEESDISKWAFPDNADLLQKDSLENNMLKWAFPEKDELLNKHPHK